MVLDKIQVIQWLKMKFALDIWGDIWYNNSVVGRCQPGNPAGPGMYRMEVVKMDWEWCLAEMLILPIRFLAGRAFDIE